MILPDVAFGDFVIAAAEEAGVPTELLELEGTERRLIGITASRTRCTYTPASEAYSPVH